MLAVIITLLQKADKTNKILLEPVATFYKTVSWTWLGVLLLTLVHVTKETVNG